MLYNFLYANGGLVPTYACLTELTPEWVDENGEGRCTVGIWFKPLNDEVAHSISKKYQLYKG